MAETFKIIEDEQGREALEILDTMQSRRVIDKQSIIDEISRLQELLTKFPKK